MKTIKSFLLLLIFLISTNFYASTTFESKIKGDPFSEEINRMLSRSTLIIEDDVFVKVIFVVTEEKKIEIRSISSTHAGVKSFLEARLHGQQLQGNWFPNKIYELPVRVKALR